MDRPFVRVFISGPYTQGNQMENMRAALDAAEKCLDAGLAPFVPHLSGFWHFVYPHEYETWMVYDFAWLELCDLVLRLPGESDGADREVNLARSCNIPVLYSVEEVEAFVDRVFPQRRYVTPERE